jgi:hypothetical protein
MTMIDIRDDLDEAPSRRQSRAADASRFPCQSCAGTGLYQGRRVHQTESRCFACGGKGWFKTSPFDRAEKRVKSVAKKVDRKAAAFDAFLAEEGETFRTLESIAGWHNGARTLVEAARQWNCWTEKQAVWAHDVAAKTVAKRGERDADKAAKGGDVDVSKVTELLENARRKRATPRFLAGDLAISLAKATGKNPGAVYVKSRGGEYFGKIVGGRYFATREAPADTLAKLLEITVDPMGVAVAHGRLTGECACCGRELSDPVSIAKGIGPICESKWF